MSESRFKGFCITDTKSSKNHSSSLLPLSLIVLFVGLATSGIFFNLFLFALGRYPFDVYKKKKAYAHFSVVIIIFRDIASTIEEVIK